MRKLLKSPGMVLLVLALFGCDDSTDTPPVAAHDFGINDPNLHVVMGDSISSADSAWPFRLSLMLGKAIVNRAVAGEWAMEGAERVEGVLAEYRPGHLLVLYGANDVIMGQQPSSTVEHLRHIVQTAKANQTIPVVATLTPMIGGLSIFQGGVDAVNELIVQMGVEEDVQIVRLDEVFGDGTGYLTYDCLHPNDSGQQLIAEVFCDVLQLMAGDVGKPITRPAVR